MTFRKRTARGKNTFSGAVESVPRSLQLTVKILEFLPEGSGTGFLHKKRVPEIPLPSSPGLIAE